MNFFLAFITQFLKILVPPSKQHETKQPAEQHKHSSIPEHISNFSANHRDALLGPNGNKLVSKDQGWQFEVATPI